VVQDSCPILGPGSFLFIKFYKYRKDEKYLKKVLKIGSKKAGKYASKKMEEVKEKLGLRI